MIALITRITLVIAALTALILFLPASSGLPPEVADSLQYFIGVARSFDWLFPLNTLFLIFKLFVLFEVGVLFFKIIRWFLHLFTTGSAGSS